MLLVSLKTRSANFSAGNFPDSMALIPNLSHTFGFIRTGLMTFSISPPKKGKTSGNYGFDRKNQLIDWSSGDLSKLVGHYLPDISGAAVIMLKYEERS